MARTRQSDIQEPDILSEFFVCRLLGVGFEIRSSQVPDKAQIPVVKHHSMAVAPRSRVATTLPTIRAGRFRMTLSWGAEDDNRKIIAKRSWDCQSVCELIEE